jgi:hypothetical protein
MSIRSYYLRKLFWFQDFRQGGYFGKNIKTSVEYIMEEIE